MYRLCYDQHTHVCQVYEQYNGFLHNIFHHTWNCKVMLPCQIMWLVTADNMFTQNNTPVRINHANPMPWHLWKGKFEFLFWSIHSMAPFSMMSCYQTRWTAWPDKTWYHNVADKFYYTYCNGNFNLLYCILCLEKKKK